MHCKFIKMDVSLEGTKLSMGLTVDNIGEMTTA